MQLVDPDHEWECPRCGSVLHGQGPASLNYAVTNHRWDHERADRQKDLEAQRRAAAGNPGMPGYQGRTDQVTLCGAPVPFDEAFYDGARLTPGDRIILHGRGAVWDSPRPRPELRA